MRAAIIPLVLLASCVTNRTVRVDDVDRHYVLHVPKAAPSTAPLVVILHGGGGNAKEMRAYSGFDEAADENGVIVAYPNAHGNRWNDGRGEEAIGPATASVDDVAFLRALVQDIARVHPIDRQRVVLAGFSNGAMMTLRMACEAPGSFTAYAAVSGSLPEPVAERCASPQAASVTLIHGTEDTYLPYQGGKARNGMVIGAKRSADIWRRANRCPGPPPAQTLDRVADDGTRAQVETSRCGSATTVELIIVEGGGHAWPSGPPRDPSYGRTTAEISANKKIVELLRLP